MKVHRRSVIESRFTIRLLKENLHFLIVNLNCIWLLGQESNLLWTFVIWLTASYRRLTVAEEWSPVGESNPVLTLTKRACIQLHLQGETPYQGRMAAPF